MAISYAFRQTAGKTVPGSDVAEPQLFAQLAEVLPGEYIVVAKAIVRSSNRRLGLVEFRIRAHPTNPHHKPKYRDEDVAAVTLRLAPAEVGALSVATIALTFATAQGEPFDIDFEHLGYIALDISNVKIMAIGVDDIKFRGT